MAEYPTKQIEGESTEPTLRIPENRFYVPAHIKEDSLVDIVKAFRELENRKPDSEVLVQVNTWGGDLGASLELAFVMHHSSLKITTLVTDRAQSAGIIIAAAGDVGKRFAYPESDFLIHPSSYTLNGTFTLKNLDALREKKARLEERYTSLIAALTGNPQERIIELFDGDNYMNAQEAQAFGIVDHIAPQIKPSR